MKSTVLNAKKHFAAIPFFHGECVIIINTLFEIGKNFHSSAKNLQSNLYQLKNNNNNEKATTTIATTNKQTTTATTTKNSEK